MFDILIGIFAPRRNRKNKLDRIIDPQFIHSCVQVVARRRIRRL